MYARMIKVNLPFLSSKRTFAPLLIRLFTTLDKPFLAAICKALGKHENKRLEAGLNSEKLFGTHIKKYPPQHNIHSNF